MSSLNKNKEFFKILEEVNKKIDDRVISNSIEEYLYWYINQAKYYKWLYRIVASIHLVGLSFMPAVAIWKSEKPIFLAVISGITGSLYGVLSLYNPREKWKRYRKTAELIKAEINFFYSRSLKEENNINNFKIDLNETITKLAIEENLRWFHEDKGQTNKRR